MYGVLVVVGDRRAVLVRRARSQEQNKEWVKDLRLMLQLKEKAEIQAFASHSFQYLTDDYLPRKLETGDWI